MNVIAPTSAPPMARKPLYKSLFFQILVAVLAGILIGHFWPDLGAALRPLGDGFIQLIKMIIAPLIFLVIVTGIAAVSDGAAIVFIGLLFVVAWVYPRVPLGQFMKYTREEFLLALGTASTESVLPRIMPS